MISAIFDVLTTIGDFFKSLFDFVFTLIKDIVEFTKMLVKLPEYLGDSLGFLPPVLLGGVGAVVVVIILLRVLGRD